MGGKSSKTSTTISGVVPDVPTTEAIEIQDILPEYPPPRPANNFKSDIFKETDMEIADEAATQTIVENFNTVEDLVQFLKSTLTTDVQIARAVFKWIGLQGIRQRPYPNKIKLQSPLGHLKQVAMGKLAYTTLYTILCRSAGVPCVILRGMAKAASYDVGMKNMDKMRNTWNAVYVAGGWRIVMPLWALSAVVGKSTGTWTLVESKGQGVRAKEEANEGVVISTINEYFFLTNPDEFVCRCFPDDEKWQLTLRPMSKQTYQTMPYLRPAYFHNKLQITSKFQGTIVTENGLCTVSIKSKDSENPAVMSYELFFNHEESKNSMPSDVQLDKYVALMNERNVTHFSLRFPISGVYKLQILDADTDWICFFRIECGEARKKCEPYPINSEIGFGPCADTVAGGLQSESHHKGLIGIRGRKKLEIKFKRLKDLEVKGRLVHNSIDSNTLAKHVSSKIKGDKVIIETSVPQNGEYALQVDTRDKNSGEEFETVCNYLLTSEDTNKKQRNYENPIEKNARTKLSEILSNSRDPTAIQSALDKFTDLDIEDHGEVQQAKERIEYLALLQGLKNGILRRDIDTLEKAVEAAVNSEYHRNRLQPKIDEAEELLQHLRQLRKYTHEVLEMKQTTISELHRYKVPKPIVHDVMMATFLLLGEKEYKLEDWPFIQNQMRKTGREGVLFRIRKFSPGNLDPDIAEKTMSLLKKYNKESVTLASAGAGTFFIWAYQVASGDGGSMSEIYKPKQNGHSGSKTSRQFSNGTVSNNASTRQSQDHEFSRPHLPQQPHY